MAYCDEMLSVAHINRRRRIGGGGGGGGSAPSFVAASSSTNLTTCDWPTGIADGDVVVLMWASDLSTTTAPTGFTTLFTGLLSNTGHYLGYHVYDSGTSGATIANLTAVTDGGALALAFRGQNETTPVSDAAIAHSTSGTPNPPAITSSGDGAIVIFGINDDDMVDLVPPSGYENAISEQFGSAENGVSVGAGYLLDAPAGAYDPGLFTGALADSWKAFTLCVRAP